MEVPAAEDADWFRIRLTEDDLSPFTSRNLTARIAFQGYSTCSATDLNVTATLSP